MGTRKLKHMCSVWAVSDTWHFAPQFKGKPEETGSLPVV